MLQPESRGGSGTCLPVIPKGSGVSGQVWRLEVIGNSVLFKRPFLEDFYSFLRPFLKDSYTF